MTADDCWKHCCCHTTEEKLAWAAEHGITPPQYVMNQLAQEEGEPACCCSQAKEKQTASATKTENCCDEEEVVEQKAISLNWFVSIHAIRCQGHDGWSLLANTVVMDPTVKTVELSVNSQEALVPLAAVILSTLPSVPDAPPPRS